MRSMPGQRQWRPDPGAIARSRASLAVATAFVLSLGLGAAAAKASGAEVSIAFRAYQPNTTTVTAGETVKWTNRGFGPHTVTAVGGTFDSGALAINESFSVTFTTPGSFLYACTIHPTMKGTVIVRSAQAAQVVQASVQRRRGKGGVQRLLVVQAPRPGATVLVEVRNGSRWQRVAVSRLSLQGSTTVRLKRSIRGPLRVVVPAQEGEERLVSRVLHPAP